MAAGEAVDYYRGADYSERGHYQRTDLFWDVSPNHRTMGTRGDSWSVSSLVSKHLDYHSDCGELA